MNYPFQDSIKRSKDEIVLGNAEINRNFEEEDVIDMLFEMSREFDFIADEDDLYGITDVGGLVDLIKSLME